MEIVDVQPESHSTLRERVFSLRYSIYIEEFKLPLRSIGRQLSDGLDDYSTNFLLHGEGSDVGTLRLTDARKGQMEFETQSDRWFNISNERRNEGIRVAEFTRLMVRNDYRGRNSAKFLIQHGLRFCASQGINLALFAGKRGELVRYFQGFGATVVDTIPQQYKIDDHTMGLYYLMGTSIETTQADS
ncbi:MAG: GNAT family N-acyltransferase [Planctomycetota bacterium]